MIKVTIDQVLTSYGQQHQTPTGPLGVIANARDLPASTKFALGEILELCSSAVKRYGRLKDDLIYQKAEKNSKTGELEDDGRGRIKFPTRKVRIDVEDELEELRAKHIILPGDKLTESDLEYRADKQEPEKPKKSLIDDISSMDLWTLKWLFDHPMYKRTDPSSLEFLSDPESEDEVLGSDEPLGDLTESAAA